MKHAYIAQYMDGSTIKEEVEAWIEDNKDYIDEIVEIEYSQEGNIYMGIITYLEKNKF